MFWYRAAFGGTAIELTKLYPATLPQYVMIQRLGNLFSAGVSTDGVHYTLIPGSTADLDMPATTLAGAGRGLRGDRQYRHRIVQQPGRRRSR